MTDPEVDKLESEFVRINIKNTGPTMSKIVSEDLNEAKENVDIDKVLQELKQDPVYDIPADYKLPEEDTPFIPISTTPELFEDFIQKVTDLRTKHSNRKFCCPIVLSDLQEEEAWSNAVDKNNEEYECYIKDIKGHFSGQPSQEPPVKSVYLVSNDLEDKTKGEAEFMKVIKQALVNDGAVDKSVFLNKLDEAIKIDNSRDFNRGCTCYVDSDGDSQ